MAITQLLKELSQQNIQLALNDAGDLRVIADKGTLNEQIKAELASNKEDIVRWLSVSNAGQNDLPLVPLDVAQATYPLSNAQQRLWFVDQLEDSSTAYTIAAASKITGKLDIEILRAAITKIVHRHESLRTQFGHHEGEGFQRILESVEPDVQAFDLCSEFEQNAQSAQQNLHATLQREVALRFDLKTGPLLRLRIYRLGQAEYVMLVCFHHIVSDGWSNQVFLRELAFYYDALQGGDLAAELPPLPIQYKDFSVWQKQSLASDYKESLLAYWREQLAGWQVLNLIHDFPRSAQVERAGSRHASVIDAELTEIISQRAQQQSVTLFTQLLSAFYVLLAKLSGQKDICIGTDVANRSRQETEHLIGFFVNQLVLRAKLSGCARYVDLVQHVNRMTLAAYEHQDLPFDVLVDELLHHHDLAHSPFFPVKFIMQNNPDSGVNLDDWQIETLELPSKHAKFEMTWSVTQRASGLEVVVEYDRELFRAETVSFYVQAFVQVLRQVTLNPDIPMHAITLADEHALAHYCRFNRCDEKLTAAPSSLANWVERYAHATPQQDAVRDLQGVLSYQQLNAQANKLANVLRDNYGVEPDCRVGVCLPSGMQYITTVVALSKLGATLVAIDSELPSERIAQIIQDAELASVISESQVVDVLPTYELNFIGLCCLDEIVTELAQSDEHDLHIDIDVEALAYMIFTSGTTGKPKGVMVSHRGLTALAAEHAERFSVSTEDRVLQFASIGFDASIWELTMALAHGACVCCAPRQHKLPGELLAQCINEFGITHITLPPSALSVMSAADLPSLKVLVLAGEACNDELLNEWQDTVKLYNAYGPSETTVCATIADFDSLAGGFDQRIGFPITGTDVYILDADGQLAPPGMVGELCIGGMSVGQGYWQDPHQTAARFIADNFSGRSGSRLYRTGDKARYAGDGGIEFLGRLDNQVKLRGYRIELQEIENQLLKLRGTQQAVVVVNEVEQTLYAFIVCDYDQPDQAEIKNKLRRYLPEYMIPKAITKLDSIPTNLNGKVDIKALPQTNGQSSNRAWQRQSLSELESQIHDVWTSVLDLEGVDKYQNFFDVGGYSLLLIKVQEHLQQRLGVELGVADLFKYPTIAGLAEFLESDNVEPLFTEVDDRIAKRRQSIKQRERRNSLGTTV